MADEATRRVVAALPLLKTNAGPRDRELWIQRLKEEYQALIKVRTLSIERREIIFRRLPWLFSTVGVADGGSRGSN